MNAIEIAECFELYACDHKPDGWPAIRQGTLNEAAAQLRRQHEAIVKLREALEEAKAGLEWYQSMVPAYTDGSDDEAMERINSALADTEDLK